MMTKICLAVAVIVVAAGLSGQPAHAQQSSGVKSGVLTCDVASGWGFVFGLTRDLKCVYAPITGPAEHYRPHRQVRR